MRWIAWTSYFITLSCMANSFIPFDRPEPRVESCEYSTSRNSESPFFTTHYCGINNELFFSGRQIHNIGPNDIIDNIPDGLVYPSRSWQFISEDYSQRETWLWLTDDVGTGAISDYMESAVVILPRKQLPQITEQGDHLLVTLTTGEEVTFHQKYKTIVAGSISELPIDTNPNRPGRKFAQFEYHGFGVVLRSNASGADPRLSKFLYVIKKGLPDCKVATKLFWTQEDWPKFRFVRDEDAYATIASHCGTQYIPTEN